MKNILISDEEEEIYLFSDKILKESDINLLENIVGRLLDKIAKLERNAPTPEGTRLNILEYVHDTLQTAQAKTCKILEALKEEVATLAQRQNLNRKAHTRIYKEMDDNSEAIADLQYSYIEDVEARKRRDKRLTDIEEFMGDL